MKRYRIEFDEKKSRCPDKGLIAIFRWCASRDEAVRVAKREIDSWGGRYEFRVDEDS